ncbi:MAG: glycosyltransferase, partial [Armatimonadota bacterium]|nr:glycosyltransferase [Armatimonadota bacterium]
MLEHYLTLAQVRELTAMVVPVWFAPEVSATEIAALLSVTLADAEAVVPPDRLVVVIDGAQTAAGVAAEVQRAFAARAGAPFRLVVLEQNRGKGGAILAGLEALPPAPFTVVRDADGDHFVNDVPHLVRLAHQMATECAPKPILVIGRRGAVHPPLGWVRGEYELLLNDLV